MAETQVFFIFIFGVFKNVRISKRILTKQSNCNTLELVRFELFGIANLTPGHTPRLQVMTRSTLNFTQHYILRTMQTRRQHQQLNKHKKKVDKKHKNK